LREDLGRKGDITSAAIFPAAAHASAVIRSKQAGILSGAYLLKPLFAEIDCRVNVRILLSDGSPLTTGSEICRLRGPIRSILAGERLALNFLQRLSGIATQTAAFVKRISPYGARVLDTRKTVPSFRAIEKLAVVHGGGNNHRFGLYDAILIKDTHVAAAGGVAPALQRVKRYLRRKSPVFVEVEVQSFSQLKEAAALMPDRIMLDNMPHGLIRKCVRYVRSRMLPIELEASGNISLSSAAQIARTGVDFLSAGALTHSVKALDIHLQILQ
jgi:nicotinate-nucleotide pyrophosphorylase (carboxylating)